MKSMLQFDDAIDALYKRHDGGQDTRKGVRRVTEYPDYDRIPDPDAAALLVSLDIYRGVPVEGETDVFVFGSDGILAESAPKAASPMAARWRRSTICWAP